MNDTDRLFWAAEIERKAMRSVGCGLLAEISYRQNLQDIPRRILSRNVVAIDVSKKDKTTKWAQSRQDFLKTEESEK